MTTPNVSDYIHALRRLENQISPTSAAFLQAHYDFPDHTATATELAIALGFRNYRATNLHYSGFAKRLVAAFGKRLPSSHDGIGVIVIATGKSAIGHWNLRMRPEVVSALEMLGWCDGSNVTVPQVDSASSALTTTQIKALRASRLGQGLFRAGVVNYWEKCAVTGCSAKQLLMASHIKPWRSSNNGERLDPSNGLLLTPNLHGAFDIGLISFDDDGKILFAKSADPAALAALGVKRSYQIKRLNAKHRNYLKFHRKNVFAG